MLEKVAFGGTILLLSCVLACIGYECPFLWLKIFAWVFTVFGLILAIDIFLD
jgi:hypothetical protein